MNNILYSVRKKVYSFKTNAVTIASILALLICWASSTQAQSQQVKSPLQLADQYFAAGEYYTAANLYEQYLNPSKKQIGVSEFPLNIKGKRMSGTHTNVSRKDILFKQAESYRLANYWREAAASYRECAENNPSQYSDAIYWCAVCERSLAHYDTAWQMVQQYLSSDGDHTQYKDAAEKELQTLLFIRQQLSRPDSILVKTQKLNAPNSNEKGLFAAAHIGGDQFLITSTQPDSLLVAGVNPYHSHLFYATLNDGGLQEMFPADILRTTPITNQGAATISADGNYLYFSQWKKENARLPDAQGKTISSIYYASRQNTGWSAPALLPSVNINGYSSKQPFCSTDGKYLFFASDRPGGSGGFDIWYASLKNDGTTDEPVNVGSAINTSADEQAPFYHTSSSQLVFSSNGRLGMGGYDLFAATGNETTWKPAENLGYPVNSSRDDIYFFAPEKTTLLSNAVFSSDRGEGCCLETYNIKKAPKSKRLAGVVRDCQDNSILADAEVILKDAAGQTWKTSTNSDGKYIFDLGNNNHESLAFAIKKELYLDTTASSKIDSIDESDLLTDKLTNADLCMQKKPEEKPEEKIVIKAEDVVTVYFDFDRSILKTDATNKLDSIYNVLEENPAATIQISGYTDGLGTIAYNNTLSDRRARACADYLIKKGIEATRVSFVSFGKCCPIEMEIINGRDNPDGRSRNRRALINVKND